MQVVAEWISGRTSDSVAMSNFPIEVRKQAFIKTVIIPESFFDQLTSCAPADESASTQQANICVCHLSANYRFLIDKAHNRGLRAGGGSGGGDLSGGSATKDDQPINF